MGGQLFAEGGAAGSATTGQWATAGMTFYLVDQVTQQSIATVTIQAGGGNPTFTASPNPLPNGVDVVTLDWSAPGSAAVEIYVDSPSGTLFAEGGPTGAATTGAWASSGMTFYLVDASTHAQLSSVTLGSSQPVPLSYVVHTVAGGISPNGLPATSVGIGQPGVAVDSQGNLYAILNSLNVVVRIDGATGLMTTIAGNGTQGYNGDNIPATSAELSFPEGIAVDSHGNVFIADTGNCRIREVSNGIITTVAGNGVQGYGGDNGPATSAELYQPPGIAIDSSGNLYIADSGNNRVRIVSNGIIATFAGTGQYGYNGDSIAATSAELHSPTGVAVDSNGNVYIADWNNNRVREVSNGTITTLAGTGQQGYNGDNIPAVSASLDSPMGVATDGQGAVYIADSVNERIRQVSSGIITTVAGNGHPGYNGDNIPATSATLLLPNGVAVDSQGNVYISDSKNQRVRQVSNGTITTVVGNGTAGYNGDSVSATSAQLDRPNGVAVDSQGNIYVADLRNGRVREISNGMITTLAGEMPMNNQLSSPTGVAIDSQSNLYVSDSGGYIFEISNGVVTNIAGNGAFGYSGDNGPATSASFALPNGVAVDSQGNIYIADTYNNRIRKISNGIITTIAGNDSGTYNGDNIPATSATLYSPNGVAVDSQGNVYIADTLNYRIREISNGVITTIAGTGVFGDSGNNVPAASAPIGYTSGIAVDAQGNVFYTDVSIHEISNGIVTTIAGGGSTGDNVPATLADAQGPLGLCKDSLGNIYFGTSANSVRVLIPQGAYQSGVSLSVSPDVLPAGPGVASVNWNAPDSASTELRVNAPTGTLFAAGTSSGSATTGDWASAGMTFYLLDSGTKHVLGAQTILSDTATLSASPSGVNGVEAVTLTWNAPSSLGVEIRVSSPTGALFAAGGSSGSAPTGIWVSQGTSFYLLDDSTHAVLASIVIGD
jgi:trimeric autotransporter adhesin